MSSNIWVNRLRRATIHRSVLYGQGNKSDGSWKVSLLLLFLLNVLGYGCAKGSEQKVIFPRLNNSRPYIYMTLQLHGLTWHHVLIVVQ
jgi:hypothetical protein